MPVHIQSALKSAAYLKRILNSNRYYLIKTTRCNRAGAGDSFSISFYCRMYERKGIEPKVLNERDTFPIIEEKIFEIDFKK